MAKKANTGAWSPEARAKAAATRARNKAEKDRLAASEMTGVVEEVSLDAIPDRAPVVKRKPKAVGLYTVTEKEYMFLQMAKMMLGSL